MAAHLSLLPYWAFGLALAGSFYGGMIWLGAHFRPEFRQSLTEWLQGHRDRTWADSFLALFDTLFDARHVSARRLWRSALASVLAVAVLYLLFAHVLGVWHTRTMGQLALWQALAALVMVNILADYLSLIETRWLLERFRTVRSVAGQAALLLADLVFTGAIVLALLYAFSRLVLGEAPRAIDVLALFSVYSIFFYSTFLTSIWAWLHCASAWFVRLFTRLGLGHILDVTQKPVQQIALVGAGLILLGTLALGPALRAEPGSGASRLDAWLCERDLPSCFLAARASLAAGDTGPTRLFVENACRAEEDDGNCDARLRAVLQDDHATINAIWRRACEGGYPRACRAYGWSHHAALGMPEPDYARAADLYRRACDEGDSGGCSNLGFLHQIGRGVALDRARAVALFEQACDRGSAGGCSNLGFMYERGQGIDADLARAISLYRRGCDGGTADACQNLGVMHARGRGVTADRTLAVSFFRRGCDRGSMRACANLGVMLEHGDGIEANPAQAAALYRQSCDGGNPTACSYLGFMYQHGKGVDPDRDRALALYRQGCDDGDSGSCARYNALNDE